MIFLLKFLFIFALIGGVYGYFARGKTKEALGEGVMGGLAFGLLTAFQFICIGFLALAGIWFVIKIF